LLDSSFWIELAPSLDLKFTGDVAGGARLTAARVVICRGEEKSKRWANQPGSWNMSESCRAIVPRSSA
jgi:hypothetical protein